MYQGSQLETVYHREDDGSDPDRARLTHVATNVLRVGDITRLVPPEGDIHKIETMDKDQPSISIHILGNDIGCRWRHAFEGGKGRGAGLQVGVRERTLRRGLGLDLRPYCRAIA